MPRDIRAYLSDVIDSCDAINSAVGGPTIVDDVVWEIILASVPGGDGLAIL
jgi:hypothetical protein